MPETLTFINQNLIDRAALRSIQDRLDDDYQISGIHLLPELVRSQLPEYVTGFRFNQRPCYDVRGSLNHSEIDISVAMSQEAPKTHWGKLLGYQEHQPQSLHLKALVDPVGFQYLSIYRAERDWLWNEYRPMLQFAFGRAEGEPDQREIVIWGDWRSLTTNRKPIEIIREKTGLRRLAAYKIIDEKTIYVPEYDAIIHDLLDDASWLFRFGVYAKEQMQLEQS